MGLFKSEEQYLEYSTNIKELFSMHVDKPQFIEKDDGFCGGLNGDSFWFYKRYPFMRNSFRTVLYGKIIDDHTISFYYGKFLWAQIITLCVDAGFLSFILTLALPSILFRNDRDLLVWSAGSLAICSIVTVIAFIRPKGEKEILYRHLRKICGPITTKSSD